MGPFTVFVLGGVTALLAKDTLANVASKSLGSAIRIKRKVERAAAAAIEDAEDATAGERASLARDQKPS